MLSQKLEKIVADIEATAATATQRESAVDLRTRLRDCAQRQACYRCDKAGFVVVWDATHKEVEKHDWHEILTVCHSWHSLPKDDAYGMHLPAAQFFCSDEENKSQGGAIADSFDDFDTPDEMRAAQRERIRPDETQGSQQHSREGA